MVNYRCLYNINYFCIHYTITHFCTGGCKFGNKIFEDLYSPPFVDIPNTAYNDESIKNCQYFFMNHIYININTLCNEKECIDEAQFYVKKYEILAVPLILSIYVNVSNYNELKN